MAASETENVPSLRNLTKPGYGRPEKAQHRPLQDLVRPHVESFNWFLREGLSLAVQAIHGEIVKSLVSDAFDSERDPMTSLRDVFDTNSLERFLQDASVGVPTVAQGNAFSRTLKVFPAECRERGTTYRAGLQARIAWSVDGVNQGSVERMLGEIPLMVKSAHCNLSKLTPAELIKRHEEAEEMGGYFINNGIEKVVRMLPMAIVRPSWKGRGKLYTEYGVSMRCVTKDQTAATIVLHYLTNGTVTLCFVYKKEQFFVPIVIILKALVEASDKHIYSELIKGKEDNSFFKGCVASMLRQAQNEGLMTQAGILKYIGERFRVKLPVPDWYTDEEGECSVENQDSPMMQEMLLAGHLYLTILKDKLELWLTQLRYGIDKRSQDKGPSYKLDTVEMMSAMRLCSDVTRGMEHFMATGSVVSKSNLGLMQTAGLTVVADKLNFMRYLSHFRCVHRGAFFAEMRTTSVRKLLPEAWGFLCPVHTPDGAPCGLLNHMTASCEAVALQPSTVHIPKLLCSLGMAPLDSPPPAPPSECYTVLQDGKVVGRVAANMAPDMAKKLRMLKVTREGKIPVMTEIVLVPKTGKASQFPGLFLFTTPARMMRPVRNLFTGTVEMIGSFEQVYMNICVRSEEAHPGVTTHQELRETSILSVAASFTPFSDFNQSPRNMYQCQMGKQTMGTPLHAFGHRTDNKLYRIQNPQSPTVRPYAYDHYHMDDYPLGTNAVVAVISYTGYDMEDAMILNKSSLERGFGHGTIYKTEIISLRDLAQSNRGPVTLVFGCAAGDKRAEGRLDDDGLPPIGSKLESGDPYYSYMDKQTGEARVVFYKNQEKAIVDNIKVLGNDQGTSDLNKVAIVMRIN
ncbi:DNA-directed RNA polymerase I subunit RPA2, partial [Branchiostoma belcheri]